MPSIGCYAEEYCKKAPDCNKYCVGYVQMRNVYHFSRIPMRYRKKVELKASGDKAAFIELKGWMDNVEENVNDGKCIFITSPNKGNGKTSWACKIMNEFFRKVALSNNLRCRGVFVNVPEFLQEIRSEISSGKNITGPLIEDIKAADLVIWDDVGTEKPSDWVREQLYILINHRDANQKSQIYTSNLSLEQLKDDRYLGDRIVSRISQALVVTFKGNDRRR